MHSKFRIRRATSSDWPGILPLFEQLYHGDIGPDLRNVFTTLATDKENRIFMAEQDNKLVGAIIGSFYLDVDWEGKVAKLQAIVVDEHYRRRGIGRKLYQRFLTYAKKQHTRAITARVNQQNKGAMAFYERLAFNKAETIEHIMEIKQDPTA